MWKHDETCHYQKVNVDQMGSGQKYGQDVADQGSTWDLCLNFDKRLLALIIGLDYKSNTLPISKSYSFCTLF